MKKVAILGATSHIAKNLIYYFSKEEYELYLICRDLRKINLFIEEKSINNKNITIIQVDSFDTYSYDVIINCIGITNSKEIKQVAGGILLLTEQFDNLVLNYLSKYNDALYINFSSGAVYGEEFNTPANKDSKIIFHLNKTENINYYALSKMNGEFKHRGLKNYNIVDLRIFSFYSAFINEDYPFLINEIYKSIVNKSEFYTTGVDFFRDYIHPEDLFRLIKIVMEKKQLNLAIDVCSKKPISKFSLLEVIQSKYDFNLVKNYDCEIVSSVTGLKKYYYSENRIAEEVGFYPHYTSLEAIILELDKKLNKEIHKSISSRV